MLNQFQSRKIDFQNYQNQVLYNKIDLIRNQRQLLLYKKKEFISKLFLNMTRIQKLLQLISKNNFDIRLFRSLEQLSPNLDDTNLLKKIVYLVNFIE